MMNYNEALEYIHSVSWTFCKPGLDRIRELLNRLSNPQKSLKFIHVAGTNGKGSFCSMLHSILKEQGYRVGLFTSPYVKCFNERIAINGEMISNADLATITEQIKPIASSMADKPTEFELITAIGLEYFKKQECDFVILECGLGGRLDSTNIIENSILSVITGIDFDHTAILGNTIKQITYEKAGIIKNNTPILWCGSSDEAKEVISREAEAKNAPLICVDRTGLNVKKQTLEGTFFDYTPYCDVEIKLLGTYQVENATNVLNAVRVLQKQGIAISNSAVMQGLKNARWQARFEIISKNPLIIFDGGHNPQGVCEAVKSIKQYFGADRVNVISGVMADKDYNFIAERISEVANRVYCITPNNNRALRADEYADVFKEQGVEAQAFDAIDSALSKAIYDARNEGRAILCLGSLYMYEEVSSLINSPKFAIA